MTPAIIAYIVVFSVASIALIMMIHHAFAATMTNRIHQLGILKSVGATKRQIRKALTNEVFACVSLLKMFGISNLSTEKTYFDRFKDNWDFLVTSEEGNYSKELLDDNSFERYRGEKTDSNVIAVNIIWDSIHSERTNRQYVPFLNDGKEILLNIDGTAIPVTGFANELPVLRESLEQYALSLVMSESYYDSLGFNLEADEYFYTIKVEDGDRYDVVKEELQKLLLSVYTCSDN